MPDRAFEYIPRKPEETVLYGVIVEQLETFLARQQARERSGSAICRAGLPGLPDVWCRGTWLFTTAVR